jgi:hypothetical protein
VGHAAVNLIRGVFADLGLREALLIGAGILYFMLAVVIGLWSRSIRAIRPAPAVDAAEPPSPGD